MTTPADPELRNQVLRTVRDFVQRDVLPITSEYERDDRFPHHLVPKMRELGLLGLIIPEEYGGLGLDFVTYAMVSEELAKGWMGFGNIINAHFILAYALLKAGTPEQKSYWLPKMATGEKRGAIALTEPNAGSDAASMTTTAVKDGEEYVVNGTKMFITNGRYADLIFLLAKTDTTAQPPHRGISAFVAERGPGLTVGRDLDKLGYRGVDTCELIFQDFRIPLEGLIGGEEGKGFPTLMSAIETGRINIAGTAVGLAQAAFEAAIKYAQQRKTFGKTIGEHQANQLMLADMATKIQAARLLAHDAAAKKDRGERCDMEAGMAKLFASEVAQQVALDSMRIHGGYGYIKEYPVERYYRDAPLLIIGEGTNEIQRLVIARNLLRQYAL